MSANKELPFFLSQSRGVGTTVDADDFLHPTVNAEVTDDSLTETQYFGLCIPEERIHGLMQCWHHPNLKALTGGVWVWQGMKPEALSCEMFNWRSFMSDRPLKNDLKKFRMDHGYGVQVLEPMKRHHLTYSDPERGNKLDLIYEAVAPAVMWANGRHFEQTMRVRGELQLAGKSYKVDSYNIRDRSWGKPRQEAHHPVPPVNWMTGVFNDDVSFNCTATDHPDLDPEWKDIYPNFKAEGVLMGGWIRKNGVVRAVTSCTKKTVRDPVTLMPKYIDLKFEDDSGYKHVMKGEIIAASMLVAWPNSNITVAMTRWEYEGMVGHGDSQEPLFHDYVREIRRRQARLA